MHSRHAVGNVTGLTEDTNKVSMSAVIAIQMANCQLMHALAGNTRTGGEGQQRSSDVRWVRT